MTEAIVNTETSTDTSNKQTGFDDEKHNDIIRSFVGIDVASRTPSGSNHDDCHTGPGKTIYDACSSIDDDPLQSLELDSLEMKTIKTTNLVQIQSKFLNCGDKMFQFCLKLSAYVLLPFYKYVKIIDENDKVNKQTRRKYKLKINIIYCIINLFGLVWMPIFPLYFPQMFSPLYVIVVILFSILYLYCLYHLTIIYNYKYYVCIKNKKFTKYKKDYKLIYGFTHDNCQLLFNHTLWLSKKHNEKHKTMIYCACLYIVIFCLLFASAVTYLIVSGFLNQHRVNLYLHVAYIFGNISFALFSIQGIRHAFSIIAMIWYHSLVCKQLLIELMAFKNKIENINVIRNNPSLVTIPKLQKSMNIYQWFDTIYKKEWIKLRFIDKNCSVTEGAGIIVFSLTIWLCLTFVFDITLNIVKYNHANEMFVFALLIMLLCIVLICIVVMFLCQITKYYYQILRTMKTISVSHYARYNIQFWTQSQQLTKYIKVFAIKGTIFKYEVSWVKVFRLTLVFALSKLVVYGFTADYHTWVG